MLSRKVTSSDTPLVRRHFVLVRNMTLAVATTIVAVGVVWVVGEIAVRYRETHRTTTPGTMPFLFYPATRVRQAMVRNYDYFGWVHVDRNGFRGDDVQVDAPPGTFRIMAVGGSTTFDFSVSSDQRAWPAQLERLLNDSVAVQPVQVINAGVGGYTVMDNLIRLETELYRFAPDVIVLYHAHNDLFGTLMGGSRTSETTDRPGEIPTITPWGRWLGRHSLLYAKLVGRWQVRVVFPRRSKNDADQEPTDWQAILRRGSEDFGRNVEAFVILARHYGIRVILPQVVHISGPDSVERDPALSALWAQAVPGVPVTIVLAGYRLYNERLRAVAEQYGAEVVTVDASTLSGAAWYAPGDPIHFNDAGSARWAEELAPQLRPLLTPWMSRQLGPVAEHADAVSR